MKSHKPLAMTEFEYLIESGTYRDMKQHEIFLKQAKSRLREMVVPWEGKRHEFRDVNMVAKFVAKKVWETDYAGMIEELLCYVKPDVVFPLIRLDDKRMKDHKVVEQLSRFLLPPTYYIKPTLNKIGRQVIGKYDFVFEEQSEEELITEIRDVHLLYKAATHRYDEFKKRVTSCSVLQDTGKVATTYGSVSMLENKPVWNVASVYEEYGEEFLAAYGKVDLAKLDELILAGIIPKSVLKNHRIMTDIHLDFIVMKLDVEERILNMHRNKQIYASQSLFR